MKGKILAWTIAIVLVALAAGAYFKFFFVFGEGIKAGELNQLVYKGWVWKTYEGRLIQTGFRSGSTGKGVTGIQANEFNFSGVDEAIADSLMRCGGKMVELRYKEYNGTLPWRGMHKYIVDEIISVRDVASNAEVPVFIGE